MAWSREKLMSELKRLSDDKYFFVKKSEEFKEDYKGGIWTTGETPWRNGVELAEFYSSRDGSIEGLKLLKKAGWYVEWYDAGTIMLWKG